MPSVPSPSDLDARLAHLEGEFGEPVTLDALTSDYKIFQRRRGHRHSTDDLLTAWFAAVHAPAPEATTLLDLGAGIGSVGLSLAWCFPDATLTAIEVQPVSFRLLCENVWANGVGARVNPVLGDLRRDLPAGSFDLVTGSPPYFDVRAGIVSPDPQRAGARFELCGDVADYCVAARRVLRAGGRFVFCFPTVQRPRTERACRAASLTVVATRDVVPREGLASLFSLFACVAAEGEATIAEPGTPFVVRDREGLHTTEMTAARGLFGHRASNFSVSKDTR